MQLAAVRTVRYHAAAEFLRRVLQHVKCFTRKLLFVCVAGVGRGAVADSVGG